MRLTEMMTLAESTTGFTGGTCTDSHAHLTLLEACGELPCAITEAGMGFIDNSAKMTDALNEATISSLSSGTEPNFEPIVEMSFEDLKKKVKAFFAKIVNFLKSIVAKLSVQIDKIRMTGSQLYSKYASKPEYRDKEPKDLTVSAYKFEKGDRPLGKSDDYADIGGAKKLIAAGVPGAKSPDQLFSDFRDAQVDTSADNDSTKDKINADIDKLKDITQDERKLNMVNTIIGGDFNTHKGTWSQDIKTALYGEKVEIKYGTAPFTKSDIAGLLQQPKDLESIKERYNKIRAGAEKFESELNKGIDSIEKIKTSNSRAGGDDSTSDGFKTATKQNAAMTMIISYYNAYLAVVTDCYNVLTTLSSIDTQYQTDRINQAKMMFGKILSYNAKKDNNDAGDGDTDVLLFDVEL